MKLLQKLSVSSLVICCALFAPSVNAQSRSVLLEDEPVFKVFPNPNQMESETYVSLDGFKAQDLLVVVYDMLGQEIYSKVEVRENDGFLFTISSDGKKLPTGIYLITASANDKIFRQKMIVK
ncbi:MAG: hypothetical protein JWO44_1658 [Bacteroidetes bacterium]|jgi:hypothetical protein|nr:hypothetical protein [Bacteroidota bacterium]